MKSPKFEDYMLPTLKIMKDGEIRTTSDIYKELIKNMNLTDEVLSEKLPSDGRPKYKSTMHWALNDLKFAGLLSIVKPGVYRITQEGLNVSKMNLERIDRRWLRKNYKAFDDYILHGYQKEDSEINIACKETPIEQLYSAESAIKDSVCSELLDCLLKGTPAFFEKVVVDVIAKIGYGVGEVTQLSNDGGIDGIIKEDKLGLDKIYIQAKRFSKDNNVDRPEIQKFSGALDDKVATKGIFITTSDFTKGAREFKPLNKNIVLISGKELVKLMYDYEIGVSCEKIVKVNKIDSDYFDD